MKTLHLKKYAGREGSGRFRRMALDEVKALQAGDHVWFLANDGSARRVQINGQPKRWKRQPDRVRVPVKYGLYEYDAFESPDDLRRLLVEVTTVGEECWQSVREALKRSS